MRYAECETVEDIEAINPVYWEDGGAGDMEGGCWLYQLPSLKNGDNMFSPTKLASTYNNRISLWKFVGNLQSLESGVNMFAGCALDYESVRRIADTLPTGATGTITIGIDHTLEMDTDVQEALAVTIGKGWTVEEEYNNYNLPYKFTELDYLQSSGTQYIELPEVFRIAKEDNPKSGIKLKSKDYKIVNNNLIFRVNCSGVHNGNTFNQYLYIGVLKESHNALSMGLNGYNNFQASTYEAGKNFTAEVNFLNSNITKWDADRRGDLWSLVTTVKSTSTTLMKNATCKLVEAVLSLGTEITRKLVPVLNADGVPGMYDTVSKTFFDNQGSGTFGYRIKRSGEEFAPTPMSLRDPYYTAPSGIYARIAAENELDILADTDMEVDAAEQHGYTWFPDTAEAYEHFDIKLTEEEVIDV